MNKILLPLSAIWVNPFTRSSAILLLQNWTDVCMDLLIWCKPCLLLFKIAWLKSQPDWQMSRLLFQTRWSSVKLQMLIIEWKTMDFLLTQSNLLCVYKQFAQRWTQPIFCKRSTNKINFDPFRSLLWFKIGPMGGKQCFRLVVTLSWLVLLVFYFQSRETMKRKLKR